MQLGNIIFFIGCLFSHGLPLCENGADTFGNWSLSESIEINDLAQHILVDNSNLRFDHFKDLEYWISQHKNRSDLKSKAETQENPLLSAMHFSQVWLPRNCSYHRFTNASLFRNVQVLQQLIESEKVVSASKGNAVLQVVFMGDSALRGIFCGITRILAGSEIFGPCTNQVCGGLWNPSRGAPDMPKTIMSHGRVTDLDFFGGRLRLSFMYVTKFGYRHLDWLLESAIKNLRPFALIFNTGAWDFDADARAHLNSTAPEDCDGPETLHIAQARVGEAPRRALCEAAEAARALRVRLLYRNSHVNKRYGALCADQRVEALLAACEPAGWEVLDNRALSREVWPQQCFDGFHFDRFQIHSEEQHKQHLAGYRASRGHLPGQLEMQLGHSLLNRLFQASLALLQHSGSFTATHP
mmetsp:Transcript_25632/g.36765  ORF Transcript_25632/g.36765 Transcript_25632/m.36765 type:complete len:411 (+) Transcript_25632:40-1272(+)